MIQTIQVDASTQTDWSTPINPPEKTESLSDRIKSISDKLFPGCFDVGRDYFFGVKKLLLGESSDFIPKSVPLIVEIFRSIHKAEAELVDLEKEVALIGEEVAANDSANKRKMENLQEQLLTCKELVPQKIEKFHLELTEFGIERPWFAEARVQADAIYKGYDKDTEKKIEALRQEIQEIAKIGSHMNLAMQLISELERDQRTPPLLTQEIYKVMNYMNGIMQGSRVENSSASANAVVIQESDSIIPTYLSSTIRSMQGKEITQVYDACIEKVLKEKNIDAKDLCDFCAYLFDNGGAAQVMRLVISLSSDQKLAVCKERIFSRKIDDALKIATVMDHHCVKEAVNTLMTIQEYSSVFPMLRKLPNSMFAKEHPLDTCKELVVVKQEGVAAEIGKAMLSDRQKFELCQILSEGEGTELDIAELAFSMNEGALKEQVLKYLQNTETEISKEDWWLDLKARLDAL